VRRQTPVCVRFLCFCLCILDLPDCRTCLLDGSQLPKRAGFNLGCWRLSSRCVVSDLSLCSLVFFRRMRLVGATQELFLKGLVGEIRDATSSKEVYPSPEAINAQLLRVAAAVMKVSENEAAKKLQEKMLLPVRKPAKGMALVLAYQYIKRVMSHLNSSLTSTAVSTFVKQIHELRGMGTWTTASASSTRRQLALSPEECMELLNGDSFFSDAHGRLATLEAVVNVIEELDGTTKMVTWSGTNKASRVIRCYFGHVANVSFRVRLFHPLRLVLCPLCGVWSCFFPLPCPWCSLSIYSVFSS